MTTCTIAVTDYASRSVKKIGPQPEDPIHSASAPGQGLIPNPPIVPLPEPPTYYQRMLGRFLRNGMPPSPPMQWEYDSFIGYTDGEGQILAPGTSLAGGRLTIGAFAIDAVGHGDVHEFREDAGYEVGPMPNEEPGGA